MQRRRDVARHRVDFVEIEDPTVTAGHRDDTFHPHQLFHSIVLHGAELAEDVVIGDRRGSAEREDRQRLGESEAPGQHEGHHLDEHGLAALGLADETHVQRVAIRTTLPVRGEHLDVGSIARQIPRDVHLLESRIPRPEAIQLRRVEDLQTGGHRLGSGRDGVWTGLLLGEGSRRGRNGSSFRWSAARSGGARRGGCHVAPLIGPGFATDSWPVGDRRRAGSLGSSG